MGWLSSTPTPVIVSVRRAVTKENQHRTYDYRVLTRTITTTVSEYRAMTYTQATTCATAGGMNSETLDAWDMVSASSSAEVQRMNEADAYKVVRTEMSVSLVVGSWINNPT